MSPLWVSSPDVVFLSQIPGSELCGSEPLAPRQTWGTERQPFWLKGSRTGVQARFMAMLEFWLGCPWERTRLALGQPSGCLVSHVGSKVSALRPAAMICWEQPGGVINMAGHRWPVWRNSLLEDWTQLQKSQLVLIQQQLFICIYCI